MQPSIRIGLRIPKSKTSGRQPKRIFFSEMVLDGAYNTVIRFLENVKTQLDGATVEKNKLQEAYNDFVEKLKVRSHTKFDYGQLCN